MKYRVQFTDNQQRDVEADKVKPGEHWVRLLDGNGNTVFAAPTAQIKRIYTADE